MKRSLFSVAAALTFALFQTDTVVAQTGGGGGLSSFGGSITGGLSVSIDGAGGAFDALTTGILADDSVLASVDIPVAFGTVSGSLTGEELRQRTLVRQAARQRQRERHERAHHLRQQQLQYSAKYGSNPGYKNQLPPRDYSYFDTRFGLVTGTNLLRHVNQTLGR